MTKNNFRYKNIFLYASLQFSGNIEEYFAEHTEKLVVFLVLPRGSKENIYRLYQKGKLVQEKKVISPRHILLYYLAWYKNYWKLILKYFSKNEKITVISFHPISFFGMKLQQLFRSITFVYWVGDFFPGTHPINIFYRHISFFYNKQIPYRCYLSDRLNEKMNGKITNTEATKTVMWGVKPTLVINKKIGKILTICFIGVIRDSQGIEFLLEVIAKTDNVYLKLLGPAPENLFDKYQTLINDYNIKEKVFFPNKTFYGKDLQKEISACHVGAALYDEGSDVGTYYADPAKVKTYAQYGLPIIMTNAADIAKYITKFHAGEVIARNIPSAQKAITLLERNYGEYIKGLQRFSEYFNYETYYKEKFAFLEKF